MSALGADETTARWALLNDAAIVDTQTELEWTRIDNGHDISWPNAQRFCHELGRNWRLPTVDELSSIYDAKMPIGVRCGENRCRVPELFDLTGTWFWSADSVGNDGSDGAELAWGLLMVNGVHTKSVKALADGSRALCTRQSTKGKEVRSGDAPPAVPLSIDQSHTAVIFSWNHRGFSHPAARLEQLSGTLFLDRRDLSKSSVKVTFPLEGLRTGNDALDRRLRGPDFFDAPHYPIIAFHSTGVDPVPGTNELTVVGDLTIHGVTQSVTLHATINQIQAERPEPAAGFDAQGVLRRSDFGLSRYVPLVGDEITIHMTLEAHTDE
jgi:polyisoprenoid-binding protein YceI